MAMQQETPTDKDKGFRGGRYARTKGGALREGHRPPREVQDRTRVFGPGDSGVGARQLMPFAPIPTHGHEPPVGGLV